MSEIAAQSSLNILVIDDSYTIRRSADIFLRQAGHRVFLAVDGLDALASISESNPNLIFCDLLMPRLSGYQTCALVKKNARFHATPVIMLSSKDGLFDRARATIVGAAAFMTKPFSEEGLLEAVNTYAERRSIVVES